jgi:hypothetical protein
MSETVGEVMNTEPRALPTSTTRRWIAAGWVTVLAGVVAWVLIVIGFSVAWEKERLPVIPVGDVWTVDVMNFTLGDVRLGIPLVTPTGEIVTPGSRAAFVVVSVDYHSQDPESEYLCSLELVGKNRRWNTTYDPRIQLGEFFDNYYSNCETNDFGTLHPSGTIAGVFEIPYVALDELEGVLLTVTTRGEDSWEIIDAWSDDYYEVILGIN